MGEQVIQILSSYSINIIIIIIYYVTLRDTHLNFERNLKYLDSNKCTLTYTPCDHHLPNFMEADSSIKS
jgi:hypothetical protein